MIGTYKDQLQLNDEGYILWQEKANSPLAGKPVARLVKGQERLRPQVIMLEDVSGLPEDKNSFHEKISNWVETYIDEKLELLFALKDANLQTAPQEIALAIFEAMGVVPRDEIKTAIDQLDDQGRAQLRFKKIRLGPVLAFIPPLNKPAAISLRAILWALWNDKPLPMHMPREGVVSEVVVEADIDRSFYKAIGYPVYGPRAIRIDMLDRVIVDVFDSSKDWRFQAKHKYCEWLGCTIEHLYEILEAMGHRKMPDEEPAKEEAVSAEITTIAEGEATPAGDAEKPKELATFHLLGLIKSQDKPARKPREKQADKKSDKKPSSQKKDKRPAKKKSEKPSGPKTFTLEIKGKNEIDQSSPFAILEQLKAKK